MRVSCPGQINNYLTECPKLQKRQYFHDVYIRPGSSGGFLMRYIYVPRALTSNIDGNLKSTFSKLPWHSKWLKHISIKQTLTELR